MYLRKWIKAFRQHGIGVAGAERFDLLTVRGFLREYAWTLWIASVSVGMFLLIQLHRCSLIHLWFAVAELVAATLLFLLARKGTR